MKTHLYPRLEGLAASWGIPEAQTTLVALLIAVAAVTLLGVVAYFITRRVVIRAVKALIRRTQTKWDDKLIERKVFDRLAQLVPGMILFLSAPVVLEPWPAAVELWERAALVYMGVVTLMALDAFLNAVVDVYEDLEADRFTPVKSYVQVVKIALYVVGAILLISSMIGRSPVVLLSSLGALSAVLILVFKDSILGLVASVQLSAQDLVRKGDWIEVPTYGADGDVIDIALTTIKVQNFDKTISTVPAYSLISDSFRNWRGMKEAGGRRIKRSIAIDMNSVRFCAEDDLARFAKMDLLRAYIEEMRAEVDEYNSARHIESDADLNGRRLTNLGTFRAYILRYLRAHPRIHQELTLLARQLPPDEGGIAIELYCFVNDTTWATYEGVQADIFDHLVAIIPEFGLRVFQAPSGSDIRAAANELRASR